MTRLTTKMVKLDNQRYAVEGEKYLEEISQRYGGKGFKFKSVLSEEKSILGLFKKSIKYAFFQREP